MAISKLILNGVTQMDVTDTTATVSDVASGKVFTQVDGTTGTGTATFGEPSIPEEPLKDVVFIDYDGEIVYQYTKAEFASLSEMPANPSHTGLTAQGWNWTLSDAKTYVQKYGALVIGQMYTTSDGKTRIYLTITDVNKNFPFALSFYTSVKNGATISWGDGTTTVTDANANTNKTYEHTYQTVGKYVATIEATSGTIQLGYNGSNATFFGNGTKHHHTGLSVNKVEIGNNVTIVYRQAFQFAMFMTSISIPKTVYFHDSNNTIFSESAITGLVIPNNANQTALTAITSKCYELKFISIPKEVTALKGSTILNGAKKLRMFTSPEVTETATNLCTGSRSLERFILSGTYTSIPTATCRDCSYFYDNWTIPSTVTSIADYACTNTYFKELHLLPTTPPTLAHQRSFTITSYTAIYVPYSEDHSVLNAYKTASNWSVYANFIQEEPQ